MKNIYYHPEDYELKIFAQVDNPYLDYAFSMFVVWQDAKGNLFYAEDLGCSCPAPFEDLYEIAQLQTIIGADGLKAFFDALTSWTRSNGSDSYGDAIPSLKTDYVRRKVRGYMTR